MTISALYKLPPFPDRNELESLSGLQRSAYRIVYETPLDELDPSDVRILCSQNLYVDVAVPKAIDLLEADPFIEADYYSGDLMIAVLKVHVDYWQQNLDMLERLSSVYRLFKLDQDSLLDYEHKLQSEYLYDKICL